LAHDANIVHRDLKPANLFLAREGRNEVVKVLDFGIAKSPSAPGSGSDTRTGALIGSPNYMSPEQIVDSKAVDWRTDIWALGVIAFQCLTGREPFPGVEIGAILVGVCSSPLPIPSQIAPDLGPHVDQFFQTALARPPEQRFQTVLDFARALHALAGGESRRLRSGPPAISVGASTQPLDGSLAHSAMAQPVLPSVPSPAVPPPATDVPSGVHLPSEKPTGLTCLSPKPRVTSAPQASARALLV
jgi:serine/threonine-protein kinase